MICNLGKTDRILRFLFGSLLIGMGIYIAGTVGIGLGAIGAILLLTGLAGYCPAYTLFKINTCKMKSV